MFRPYRFVLRQPVINILPGYTSIKIPVSRIFYYFVIWSKNAKLFNKLAHCYMFRHNRFILGEFVIDNLSNYTNISIPAQSIYYYFALWQTNVFLSQIITLLYVSTTSCLPRVACNQYVANLRQYFNTCTVHLLLFCTMTNKCAIILQIITLLHFSTQYVIIRQAVNNTLPGFNSISIPVPCILCYFALWLTYAVI